MIELEVRGRIKDFESIFKTFKKKAKFVEEKDRFSLVYIKSGFDMKRDVRELLDDPVDLRVRITNKKAEIIMKYGRWGGSDKRKEIFIPISAEKFKDAVDLLVCLGWHHGIIMATKTFVFNYKGVEFALVKNEHYNYFEAEKVVDEKEDLEGIHNEIKKVCSEFNLEIFDEEDFMDQINKINNSPENQFDFTKHSFADLKKKYIQFF